VAGTQLRWRRRHGWLALGLALAGLAVALGTTLRGAGSPARPVTLTSGVSGTTRTRVAQALASDAAALGVEVRVVETGGTRDALDRVNAGTVDLAIIPGAFPIERLPNVREVAPLYIEALHLLVKKELADTVADNLTTLHGRTVSLGPRDSTTAGMATAVLAFAQVATEDGAGTGGVKALNLELAELQALVVAGDRPRCRTRSSTWQRCRRRWGRSWCARQDTVWSRSRSRRRSGSGPCSRTDRTACAGTSSASMSRRP
jgi:hypothetical protein